MKIIPSSPTTKKVIRYCSLASLGLKELSALENRRVYGGIAPSASDTDTHATSTSGWNVSTIFINALIIFGFYKGCSLCFPAQRSMEQSLLETNLPHQSLTTSQKKTFYAIIIKGEGESIRRNPLNSSRTDTFKITMGELMKSEIELQYINSIKLKEQDKPCEVDTCNLADGHMHFKWPAEPGDDKIITSTLRKNLATSLINLSCGAVLMFVSALAALTEVAYYGVPKAITRFTRKDKT